MTMLTLLPCQDGEDISANSADITAVKKPSKGIEHYNQETCPPFCTCACCSVSRHFPIIKDQMAIFSFISVPYMAYRTLAVSERLIEIYQPPKVA